MTVELLIYFKNNPTIFRFSKKFSSSEEKDDFLYSFYSKYWDKVISEEPFQIENMILAPGEISGIMINEQP